MPGRAVFRRTASCGTPSSVGAPAPGTTPPPAPPPEAGASAAPRAWKFSRDQVAMHLEAGAKRAVLTARQGRDRLHGGARRQRGRPHRRAPHRLQRQLHHQLLGAAKVLNEPSASAKASSTRCMPTPTTKVWPSPIRTGAAAAPRRSIPTSTGAAKAVGEVLPALSASGKPDGSVVDLFVTLEHPPPNAGRRSQPLPLLGSPLNPWRRHRQSPDLRRHRRPLPQAIERTAEWGIPTGCDLLGLMAARATAEPSTVSAGLGIDFPFEDAKGFWRWVDLCDNGGVAFGRATA